MAKAKTNKMQIESRIRLVNMEDSYLRAFADVTVNDCVTIRNVKVVEGGNGLFVSMPSIKDKNGEYRSVCYVSKDNWQEFNDAVVAEYRSALEQEQAQSEEITDEPVMEQTM